MCVCIGLACRKCGQNRVVYVEGVFLHVRPVYVDVILLHVRALLFFVKVSVY